MTLTLWGAYHRLVRPLEQRSLVVHVSIDRPAELTAVVEAEGLVAEGKASVEWRRSGFIVDYRIHFLDDRGARCTLELVQRFDDWTLRACTELDGTLRDGDATAWGRARLRIDYRELGLGSVFEALGSAREIIQKLR